MGRPDEDDLNIDKQGSGRSKGTYNRQNTIDT